MKKEIINLTILFILALLGIILFQFNRQELKESEHNLAVARDSVRTLTLKNGEQVKTIGSYILEKKQLQEYLDISREEVKELEKKLGKLAYVTNIKTVVEYDSITMTDTVYIDSDGVQRFDIKYDDEWLSLSGVSNIKDNVASTILTHIAVPTPLQVGLTDDYRIWVKSKNPYLNVTDIEGAVVSGSRLNQKPKRWGLGISAGYGLNYSNGNVRPGPYVGIGLNYNLLNF